MLTFHGFGLSILGNAREEKTWQPPFWSPARRAALAR